MNFNLGCNHASPFGTPSKKNVTLNFSTFSGSKVLEYYVRSFGSGGFLRKCQIFQSLEGNFGDFSPFQIQPFLDQKMTKIAF